MDPTSEDLLETGKQYGMIQNKNVKVYPLYFVCTICSLLYQRRLGLPSIPQPRTTENAKPASSKATEIPKRTDTSRTAADDSLKSSQSGKESTKGERNAPKKDAGSIFSAFSKSKTKPKKEPINLAPSSKEEKSSLEQKRKFSAPESEENLINYLAIFDTDSEEEQGEFFPPPNPKTDMDRQKGLKEREADLKDMMEKDDGMIHADTDIHTFNKFTDEEMPDASESESEPEPEPEPENTVGIKPTEGPPRLEEVVDQAPAPPGRRRGKRQVMKKRTRKDEDGYLGKGLVISVYVISQLIFHPVTTEEPVWESFSEDEAPPPPKRKSATLANMKSAKLATKNQGSIMAFFGKK